MPADNNRRITLHCSSGGIPKTPPQVVHLIWDAKSDGDANLTNVKNGIMPYWMEIFSNETSIANRQVYKCIWQYLLPNAFILHFIIWSKGWDRSSSEIWVVIIAIIGQRFLCTQNDRHTNRPTKHHILSRDKHLLLLACLSDPSAWSNSAAASVTRDTVCMLSRLTPIPV